MAILTKSITVMLSGILLIAGAVALPLAPVFGEGGARRDVVRHAAELARAENAAPSSLSQYATIMDVDGTVHRKGTKGDDWVEGVGAHIMVLVPNVETFKNVSTDSKNGGPWVMWADTPYAHLMIPIDSYPAP